MSVHVRQVQALDSLRKRFQQLLEGGRCGEEAAILQYEVAVLCKSTSPRRMGLVRCDDVHTASAQESRCSRYDFTGVSGISKAVDNRSDVQITEAHVALHPGIHY